MFLSGREPQEAAGFDMLAALMKLNDDNHDKASHIVVGSPQDDDDPDPHHRCHHDHCHCHDGDDTPVSEGGGADDDS